jgi:hypothetical protein
MAMKLYGRVEIELQIYFMSFLQERTETMSKDYAYGI